MEKAERLRPLIEAGNDLNRSLAQFQARISELTLPCLDREQIDMSPEHFAQSEDVTRAEEPVETTSASTSSAGDAF
ncbi:hypothetical protein [Endozoicomonas ascidiicola]|uniref:hypothetical protein n=1 Tax=Endozoicomonas ascidiicola TaxID=1698521 RepID=UPI00082E68A7|nr:hypothetical protein [Endozoicomonas ascidiicola]